MSLGNSPEENHARYPGSYYMTQPIIERIIDEMDDMSRAYPLQPDFDRMLDRADQEVQREYPGFMGEDEQGRFETRDDDPPYDRDREDRDRHGYYPGYYDRRDLARDFLSVLLLSELLRRRRIYY